MEAKTVTEADVTPHGWVCEFCDKEFKPGDVAIGTKISGERGGDPYGLNPMTPDDPWTDNYVTSDWACEECFLNREG